MYKREVLALIPTGLRMDENNLVPKRRCLVEIASEWDMKIQLLAAGSA